MDSREAVGGESAPAYGGALQAWAAKGAQELHLPSGTVVQIHLTDPQTLIRLGLIPSELLDIALAAQRSVPDPTQQQLSDYAALQRSTAMSMVRAIWNGAAWEPVQLTAALADELELPLEDLEVLEAVAMRRRTVAQVNAALAPSVTRYNGAESGEEAAATVNGWEGFRGQREGVDASDGGPDLRPVTSADIPGADGPDLSVSNRRSAGRAAPPRAKRRARRAA